MNQHNLHAAGLDSLIKIAFRNLARHRLKTAIAVIAITVSVTAYIFLDGWMEGINLDSKRNIVNFETSAVKIQTNLYFEKKDDLPMYENFTDWEDYADVLRDRGYDSAPRFVFSGTLYSPTGSAPIVCNAVDPAADTGLLRYASYLDSGRFIKPGAFEIVLGTNAADKLRVGIPQRLNRKELEGDILNYAQNQDERDFILSLYETVHDERLKLKSNLPPESMNRFWMLLDQGGRMNLRLSTVIDIKALPESIRKDRFDVDLAPVLSLAEAELFHSVYEYDYLAQGYLLGDITGDTGAEISQAVLDAMIHHDYSGAVRHVYQIIDGVLVGTINSPDPMNNGNVAWLPLDTLQDEAGLMLEGHITELLIRQHGSDDSSLPGKSESPSTIETILRETLREQGREFPPELGVYGWRDYAADFLNDTDESSANSRLMTGLLFILSFIGLANTMLMSILERTKEIGMIRSQGMSDGELILTCMIESGLIGFIGAVFGALFGGLITISIAKYGIDFSGMMEGDGGDFGFHSAMVVRSAWRPLVIAGAGIAATVLSALVAFLPAWRAVKMSIAETLRFE
jgi:ABC-type lipoprotein release transport system permease subunit